MSVKNIERLFHVINNSLFTINGKLEYPRITDAIIKLAIELQETETDEFIWYIGEGGDCCLMDLIVGAYWHYSQWHNGQDSKEYVALSQLGLIYSPGFECEPDEGTSEHDVFESLKDCATMYGIETGAIQ